MRRVADFQINSGRLDGVVGEVTEARGGYSTLAERLQDISKRLQDIPQDLSLMDYKIKAVYQLEGILIVEVNPGLAYIDDVPISTSEGLTISIPSAATDQAYYIYLTDQGTLAYDTSLASDARRIILGMVQVGATLDDVSIVDMRPFLQKGGAAGEVYDARGGYPSLDARLDAMEATISNVTQPIDERLQAVETEIGEARGDSGSLGSRLDSLDAAINGLTFSETHVSTEGQQVFNLEHKYPVGLNKLRVYVGGLLMTPGEEYDYVEIDERTVMFNYPLPAGRNVCFVVESIVPHLGFQETHIAEVGQSVFTLSHPYPVGQGRLRVYVNGLLYHAGADNDYVETDEYTVTFNTPFAATAVVRFILETTSVDEAMAAGGYSTISSRLNSQLGDCNVDISIEYDEQNRPIREVWTGDVNKTIEYTYNEQGYRASEVVTEDNLVITTTYTYNEAGLITNISVRKQLLSA